MTIYIPHDAEFFIAIKTGQTAGLHSSIISGVIIDDEVIPLLNFGRVLNGSVRQYMMKRHKTTVFANEDFKHPSMTYEAYSISKKQYEELLEKAAYISDNQPLRYLYQMLSQEDFNAIEASSRKKGIYFSADQDNQVNYKFVTHRGIIIEGSLDNVDAGDNEEIDLRELAKRVLTEQKESLLSYNCSFQAPDDYQKYCQNPDIYGKGTIYFSYEANNKYSLRYFFYIEDRINRGIINLPEPFSKSKLKEYQKRVIAEELNLLGAYKMSDPETLEYDILNQDEDDNDRQEDDESLTQMTGKITPSNNCRTSVLGISEPVLGFKPKASRNFLKKLLYQVSITNGQIDSHSFYVLPQPPQLFPNLSEEQQEILETLHKRLRKIPKINPTSDATRQKFDALKRMYVDIAGKSEASADDLLFIFDTYEAEQHDALFRARSFFTKNFSRIKETSTESCFLECRSRLAPAH